MRLSAKMLKNVANVNHFEYQDQIEIFEGNENEFHFQLVDLDKITTEKDSKALPDHPLRYMSENTSLVVEFDSLFDDEKFEVSATQPFALDSSIWKVSLTEEQTPKTGNMTFRFTEDGKTKRVSVRNVIRVTLEDQGGC
jgi:hypothetical protein